MISNDRRLQILRAAERLLRLYGPRKTTVADVANEAHVAVGAVYLEFASKDVLVEELSHARYTAVLVHMRQASALPSRPYRERLRDALDARVEAFLGEASAGAKACEMFACPSPPVRAASERYKAEEAAFFAGLLREGTRAGEFEVARPEAVAHALLDAYLSLSPPSLFEIPRDEIGPRLRAMHELVLYGVITRPAANGDARPITYGDARPVAPNDGRPIPPNGAHPVVHDRRTAVRVDAQTATDNTAPTKTLASPRDAKSRR